MVTRFLREIFNELDVLLGVVRKVAALAVGGHEIHRGVRGSDGETADGLL